MWFRFCNKECLLLILILSPYTWAGLEVQLLDQTAKGTVRLQWSFSGRRDEIAEGTYEVIIPKKADCFYLTKSNYRKKNGRNVIDCTRQFILFQCGGVLKEHIIEHKKGDISHKLSGRVVQDLNEYVFTELPDPLKKLKDYQKIVEFGYSNIATMNIVHLNMKSFRTIFKFEVLALVLNKRGINDGVY